ncbi:hypothetical protein [Streptomyces tendae]|uniref:hypothetical protein n=1 Tax=Streptomyces tendae TaxID=1932 RepID=UPI0033C95359
MSAPLVVNTKDGACWTRRTVTAGGIALYAPEAVKTCPEFVMATLEDLAAHGIQGSADVLPMPVGSAPVSEAALDVAVDGLAQYLRVRLALESAKRGRREARAELHTAQAHGRTFLEQRNAHANELLELRPQLESARALGRRVIHAEQRRAELEAVIETHRQDDAARIDRLTSSLREATEQIARLESDLGGATARVAELEAARKQTTAHVEHLAKTLIARTEDLIAAEARVAGLEAAQGKALRRTVSWRLEVQENDCWWDCGQSADSYPAAQDLLARERAEKPGIGFRLVCRTTTDTLPGEASSYPPALPWAKQLDADDLEGFLADLVDAASGDDDLTTLAAVEDAIGRWRVIAEAQHAHNTAPGPDAEAGEPS